MSRPSYTPEAKARAIAALLLGEGVPATPDVGKPDRGEGGR